MNENDTIEIPANLLMALLDSGSDEGCEDSVVIDKLAFLKVRRWFANTYDIECGEVEEPTYPLASTMCKYGLTLTCNEARRYIQSGAVSINGKSLILTNNVWDTPNTYHVKLGDTIKLGNKTVEVM